MSSTKSFSTETSGVLTCSFEVSKDADELDKVERDIKIFYSLFNSSLDIKNFIKNPTQSIDQQNQFINILSEKLQFSKNLKNFFLLLIEKKRIFFVKKNF